MTQSIHLQEKKMMHARKIALHNTGTDKMADLFPSQVGCKERGHIKTEGP